jgi:ABC-type multidrug transport system fused ATPase/permease subunit
VLRSIGRHILDNLELYLMGFSVAIALILPLAIEVGTNDQELGVTALLACVFQGLVLWSMRRRISRTRREMIAELRAMLKDRINNYLTIVLMSVTQRRDSRSSDSERELLEAAIAATNAVSKVLEELSMESLHRWQAKYQIPSPPLRLLPVGERRSRPKEPASPVGTAAVSNRVGSVGKD